MTAVWLGCFIAVTLGLTTCDVTATCGGLCSGRRARRFVWQEKQCVLCHLLCRDLCCAGWQPTSCTVVSQQIDCRLAALWEDKVRSFLQSEQTSCHSDVFHLWWSWHWAIKTREGVFYSVSRHQNSQVGEFSLTDHSFFKYIKPPLKNTICQWVKLV